MSCLRIFLLVALALFASPAAARPGLAAKLDRYVRSFADSGLFSGVVLVRKNGRTVYNKAYGMAERSFGVPLDTTTRFQIASVSKPITAAAVARLADQGKLSFDDTIDRYIQGIPNGDRITIDQLLTHFSGLESPDRQEGSQTWLRFPSTTNQLVDRVMATPPAMEPGLKYYYSNGNYWILAKLIEQLSGLSYGDFLQKEIFGPLGMASSGHRGDLLHVVPHLAGGYAPEGLHGYRLADLVDWTSKTGNGSIFSTADDLSKFYDALAGGKLLKPATTERVFGFGKTVGYGWFHRDTPGRRTAFYNGRSPGYTAQIEGYPDAGMSFVILSNLYVFSPNVMAEGISAILWNEPYTLQQPVKIVPATPEALKALEGSYRFGPTFFVKSGRAEIVSRGDHLIMRWPSGGLVSTLLPTGDGTFFDPTFWATMRFTYEGGKPVLSYTVRNYSDPYIARLEPAAN